MGFIKMAIEWRYDTSPGLSKTAFPVFLPHHVSHLNIMNQNSSFVCHLTQALPGDEVYNDIPPKNGHANIRPKIYQASHQKMSSLIESYPTSSSRESRTSH